MDLNLTESNIEIQKLARDFAQNRIAPEIMKFDETSEFPWELTRELAGMGFLGILFPEELEGANLTTVDYAVIVEEISKADPSLGLTVASHNGLCTNHIYMFANEELKKKYIPDLASGRKLGAWGLTENVSGSDAAGMHTTAVKKGDFYYLNGSKNFITQGGVGETAVVTAYTDKSKGSKGISAFIAEKSFEGYSVGKKENKLGMRSSDTCELIFDNCKLPAENLIGQEGDGFRQCMTVLDGGRISIAALSVGIAQAALEHSIKYAKQRKQFGQPLSEFQGIQFKIAEMATEVEAARLLTFKAAKMKDEGRDFKFAASLAKYYASEIATRATGEAIQIHGGYGFIKEFPVEKLYRDVKLTTIGEGTSEVQKMIMARMLVEMY